MGIMNFSVLAKQSDSIHVNTTEIDGRFVVSLLELCDVNYTSSWLAGGFVCEADNGVTEGANGLPLGRSRVMLDTLTPVGTYCVRERCSRKLNIKGEVRIGSLES